MSAKPVGRTLAIAVPGPPLTAESPPLPIFDILRRLSRPIEFASRENYAHLQAVKNLGPYVQRQVIDALALGPHSVWVEVNLLALRTLFEDFEQTADLDRRRQCLERARELLRQLRDSRDRESSVRPDSERASAPAPARAQQGAAPWEQPIQFVKGVGPKRSLVLERLGVRTLEDLLWTLPWRYEDRTQLSRTSQMTPGRQTMICGVVRKTHLTKIPRRRMSILEVTVEDASGPAVAIFFNQPYLEAQLQPGTQVLLSGRVTVGRRGWVEPRLEVVDYEVLTEALQATLHLGRVVPIYHETRGWSSRQMRALLQPILDETLARVEDPLPEALRRRHKLPALGDALRAVHAPGSRESLDDLNRAVTPAHRRLAFEELFLLEMALAGRHGAVARATKPFQVASSPGMLHRLRGMLPYRLTAAQERVIGEILGDMTSPHPMNRLIQGDVGSGKTVVALHALAVACASGLQAVLMVPTELLAEQHFLNLSPLCAKLGLLAVLLSGKERGAAKRERLAQIAEGTAHIVIGTHALLQPVVRFPRLGLAVIDEQHKFGVLQRKTLVDKGYQPDVLILTATPIPRTLAMTVYGDLDVSIIDALPPGRQPIRTVAFPMTQRRKAYQIALDELRAGRQAYVVYPLVEESEKVDLEAAVVGFERLSQEEFANYQVGLIHGRLKPEERAATMAAFKAGRLRVLVATTVIEVGVDVPNASVMIVEHAERFGLAQLHQLRGRVGRGAQQSYCVLIDAATSGRGAWARETAAPSPAQQRVAALLRSTDGFLIAEEDLRIRGPGEMFGTRQSGLPEFRAANLIRDAALVELARKEAFALWQADPELSRPEHQRLKQAMQRRWEGKLTLGEVS